MVFLVIVLVVLLIASLVAIRNLLIQVEGYEDRLSTMQEFFDVVQDSLKQIINGMRTVDIGGRFKPMGPEEEGLVEVDGLLQVSKTGAFERSDEVSATFKAMFKLINQLNGFVTPIVEENAEAQEPSETSSQA